MKNTSYLFVITLFTIAISKNSMAQETSIRIKPVSGVGYSLAWIQVNYTDANNEEQKIRSEKNVPVGQEATLIIPAGATHITLEAKPLASLKKTKVFNNLSLQSGKSYCFELTGTVNNPKYETINCNWKPSGELFVFDDSLHDSIPLRGVKVEVIQKAKKIGSAFTNNQGKFEIPFDITGKVTYKVKFEDEDKLEVVWAANQHPVSHTFDEQEGKLEHTFTPSNDRKHWYWASVFNASQYYKEYVAQDNLPFKENVKISVKYEDLPFSCAPATGIQDIILHGYHHSSEVIFSLVMHELAHITHSRIDRNKYSAFAIARVLYVEKTAFGEIFACGPEVVYTKRRYGLSDHQYSQNLPLSYYNSDEIKKIHINYFYIYPIVIDLIDDYNQSVEENNNTLPEDKVSGYTLKEIAEALKGASSTEDWINNLKKINNPTKTHLDDYFKQYNRTK